MSQPSTKSDLSRQERAQFSVLIRLSWPTIVAFTVLAGRSVVDVWLAGRLGALSLAALAPAQLILLLFLSFGMGSLHLVNTCVAQSVGAKRDDEAGKYAWQGIWLSAAYIAPAALAWKAAPWLFSIFGHQPEISQLEIAYFRTAVFSLPFQLIAFAATNFFFGIARPVVPMVITILSLAVHGILGQFLTLHGFPGFPALGITGIGLTLVASSATLAVGLGLWMLIDHRLARFGARKIRFSFRASKQFLKEGIPLGAQDLLDNVIWSLVVIWLIGQLGAVPMAAATVILSLTDILMLPCDGMGSAMITLMGRSIGDRKMALAENWRKLCGTACLGYSLIFGLTLYFFREPVISALVEDEQVVALCVELGVFLPLLLFLYAYYGIFDHALCAAADNRVPTFIVLVSSLIILGGGGFLYLEHFLHTGSWGIWSLLSIYLSITAGALTLRWYSGKWKSIDLLELESIDELPPIS